MVPRLGGYCEGSSSHGGELDIRNTYDPKKGVGTLEFFDYMLQVHSSGQKLRIKNTDFELSSDRTVIIVDANGNPRIAPEDRANSLRERFDRKALFNGSVPPDDDRGE
jgi:hypothetical protein